jgi:hypothetical protein
MNDDVHGDEVDNANDEVEAPDGAGDADASDAEDLLVSEVGGLVMLVGSSTAIERFVASEPALEHSRARQVGELASLGSVLSGVELAHIAPTLFELDPTGRAMFASGMLTKAKGAYGWYRGWGRDSTKIFRQAMIRPAALGPDQLVSLQLGLATAGLSLAIKDVQRAVERVDRHVQELGDLVASILVGEVVLTRRVQAFHEHGSIADADWAAVEALGAQAEQHVAQVRTFLRKRLTASTADGGDATDRRQALEDIVSASFVLPLLLVAQANIFRFQVLRLHRVSTREPEYLEAALDEGRRLLDDQWAADGALAVELRTTTERLATLAALDIVHWDAARSIPKLVADVNQDLAAFTDARKLPHEPVPLPEVPTAGDAVDELRDRAAGVADRARLRIDAERARRKRDHDETQKELPPPPPF